MSKVALLMVLCCLDVLFALHHQCTPRSEYLRRQIVKDPFLFRSFTCNGYCYVEENRERDGVGGIIDAYVNIDYNNCYRLGAFKFCKTVDGSRLIRVIA